MSFLGQPFHHDVFVSYAHGPNDKLKHWSHCLVQELEDNISSFRTEFTDLIDIFLDKELDPTRRLTDQLQGKIKNSGLLLVIMSDHYLRSAWCNDELDWFEEELKASQKDGGLILVVRCHPTDHETWPACLKDERGHALIGFQFHPKADGDDIVFPYGWPQPLPSDRDYYKELGKLSTIVTKRLREIKERPALRANTDHIANGGTIDGRPKIYLQAPISEIDVWRLTKQIMETAGYDVLPDALQVTGSDLKTMQEARKQRLRTIGEEANALCLLGPREPNGQDREIEAIANDRIALQAFGKDLPVALLHRGQDKPTLAGELGIDAIDAAGDDWLIRFQGWLQQALETVP